MKNLQSKFKQFSLPKECFKKINGGTDIVTISPANMTAITDPYRKKDKN